MKPKGCGPRNLGSPFKQTKKQLREYNALTEAFKGFNRATDTIITGQSNIHQLASDQAQNNAYSGRNEIDPKVEDTKMFQDSKGNYVVANKHKKRNN